jgi:hypothetical protein
VREPKKKKREKLLSVLCCNDIPQQSPQATNRSKQNKQANRQKKKLFNTKPNARKK